MNVAAVKKENDFERLFEPISAQKKKVFVVDAGLTFNSPYPAILRPQRTVDLIISFDFSARPTDDSPPFKVSVGSAASVLKSALNFGWEDVSLV